MRFVLMRSVFAVAMLATVLSIGVPASADESAVEQPAPRAQAAAPPEAIEELIERAQKSVAVITVTGRDGRQFGLGTGFVVDAHGLVATNLHVIGEARPIQVQLADGRKFDVTNVEASDRTRDLALVRIDAKKLPALELGDSQLLKQGQTVLALGNPQGLRHSVVQGVVSGQREIDGRSMIQLAIPLEQGNSGGPLIDLQGRVQGVLTMKSAVTANLGFAVASNELKPLVAKPNPIPIARWLTVGALDAKTWTPVFGANWRQRAGRIVVDGAGEGFGGRSLCLATQAPPDLPYEIAVSVKLDDEAGAAGLVFGADGAHKHYGFYASAGAMRLTRFDGPDVLSWNILDQQPSPHYRPGDWNALKVRVERDQVICSVNDEPVFTHKIAELAGTRVGLAKFRDTHAEFRGFRMASELRPATISADLAARVERVLNDLPASGAAGEPVVATLLPEAADNIAALRERTRRMERQATQLRELADLVHARRVQQELVRLFERADADVDLGLAALLVARLDNEEIDVESYRRDLDRMAEGIRAGLPADADEAARIAALDKFFFKESGFHGSRSEYYSRSNSYLNEVLDDREGLPITLSIVYMELGRRLGLAIEGVGLPGHFVVRYRPAKGDPQLIDVFESGERLTEKEASLRVADTTGLPLDEKLLAAMTRRAIVVRVLHNLLGGAQRTGDLAAGMRYLDTILAIAPDSHQERFTRALLRWNTGDVAGAKADADQLLEAQPEDIELDRLQDFRALLERGR